MDCSPLRLWTPAVARSCRWPGCLRLRPGSPPLWEPPSAGSEWETPAWGDTGEQLSVETQTRRDPNRSEPAIGIRRSIGAALMGSSLCRIRGKLDLLNIYTASPNQQELNTWQTPDTTDVVTMATTQSPELPDFTSAYDSGSQTEENP